MKLKKDIECVQIILLTLTETHETFFCEKNLGISQIDTIQKMIHLSDVLPYSYQPGCMTNFGTYLKYFLFPFLGVDEGGLSIWNDPVGILDDSEFSTQFLGSEVIISLNHVAGQNFRLVLTDPNE